MSRYYFDHFNRQLDDLNRALRGLNKKSRELSRESKEFSWESRELSQEVHEMIQGTKERMDRELNDLLETSRVMAEIDQNIKGCEEIRERFCAVASGRGLEELVQKKEKYGAHDAPGMCH